MKRTFLVAVLLAMAAAAAQAEAPCTPQTQVDVRQLGAARAILVGEIHGTAEAPAFVGGLTCSLLIAGKGPVIVALERPDDEQPALERYLDSDGSAAERELLLSRGAWTWPMQDGRASEAMLALLEQLRLMRRAGEPVAVLAMQHTARVALPLSARAGAREQHALSARLNDRLMADRVASAISLHPQASVVLLAGNVHTATAAGAWAEPGYEPLGELLKSLVPIAQIGLSATEGGSAWNCVSASACQARALPRGTRFFNGPGAPEASAELGRFTASPPARAAISR